MIILCSRHNYPPHLTNKEQAKRSAITCPRSHRKQKGRQSDPGRSGPELKAYEAGLVETFFKNIHLSATQAGLLISNKGDNSLLLQARGPASVHRIKQATHMWNSLGFSSRMTTLSPQRNPNILRTAAARAVNLKLKFDPDAACLNPSCGLRTSCLSSAFVLRARMGLTLQREIKVAVPEGERWFRSWAR